MNFALSNLARQFSVPLPLACCQEPAVNFKEPPGTLPSSTPVSLLLLTSASIYRTPNSVTIEPDFLYMVGDPRACVGWMCGWAQYEFQVLFKGLIIIFNPNFWVQQTPPSWWPVQTIWPVPNSTPPGGGGACPGPFPPAPAANFFPFYLGVFHLPSLRAGFGYVI